MGPGTLARARAVPPENSRSRLDGVRQLVSMIEGIFAGDSRRWERRPSGRQGSAGRGGASCWAQHVDKAGPLRQGQRRQDAVLYGKSGRAKLFPQAMALPREAKHAAAAIARIDFPTDEARSFQSKHDVVDADVIDPEAR